MPAARDTCEIADSARKVISYPWQYGRADRPVRRIAAISQDTSGSCQEIGELLQADADLTRQARDPTERCAPSSAAQAARPWR